jgi:hypothetical protein
MKPTSEADDQAGVAERRTCLDCGCTFGITEGERRFYVTTFGADGLPRRCKRCRILARQVRTERKLARGPCEAAS